jgi:pentafunctional AROM polypeptide
VLMAFASGKSRITGIANQRVKECNRIAAMVTELSRLGFTARELPDGLEIDGCGGTLENLSGFSSDQEVAVECYKDHRIAMSFAVLGTVFPGICITDKECVDKTYPEFWVAMRDQLGLALRPPAQRSQLASLKQFDSNITIVIVGMRGSGKSMMGKALAIATNRDYLDMDRELEAQHGKISEFVLKEGWPEFRKIEYEMLFTRLKSLERGSVVSTGGGVVETGDAADKLKNGPWLVLQLVRPISEISKMLAADGTRASLGEPVETTWARREPLYKTASHFEFAIPSDVDWKVAERSFISFTRRLLSGGANLHPDSFFLCLTLPKISPAVDPNIFEVSLTAFRSCPNATNSFSSQRVPMPLSSE